jgi:hypothetical protein
MGFVMVKFFAAVLFVVVAMGAQAREVNPLVQACKENPTHSICVARAEKRAVMAEKRAQRSRDQAELVKANVEPK